MKNFLLLLLFLITASCSITRSGSFFSDIKNLYYRHIANNNEDLIALKNTIDRLEDSVKSYKDLLPDNNERINLFSYKKALRNHGLVKFQNLYKKIKGEMLLAKAQMIPIYNRGMSLDESDEVKVIAQKYYGSLQFMHSLYYYLAASSADIYKYSWSDLNVLALILPSDLAIQFKTLMPLSAGMRISPPRDVSRWLFDNAKLNEVNPLGVYGDSRFQRLQVHYEEMKKAVESTPALISLFDTPIESIRKEVYKILDNNKQVPDLVLLSPSYESKFAIEFQANMISDNLDEFNVLTQLAATREVLLSHWSLFRYNATKEKQIVKDCCNGSLSFETQDDKDLLNGAYYRELEKGDFLQSLYPEISEKAFNLAIKYPINYFINGSTPSNDTDGILRSAEKNYHELFIDLHDPDKMSEEWQQINFDAIPGRAAFKFMEKEIREESARGLGADLVIAAERNELWMRTDVFHGSIFLYDNLSAEYISYQLALEAFKLRKQGAFDELILRYESSGFDPAYKSTLEKQLEQILIKFRYSYVQNLSQLIYEEIRPYWEDKSFQARRKKEKKLAWIKKNVEHTQILQAEHIQELVQPKGQSRLISSLKKNTVPKKVQLDVRTPGELLGIVIKQLASNYRGTFVHEFHDKAHTTKMIKDFFTAVNKRYESYIKTQYDDQFRADIKNFDEFYRRKLNNDLSLLLWKSVYYTAQEFWSKYPISSNEFQTYSIKAKIYNEVSQSRSDNLNPNNFIRKPRLDLIKKLNKKGNVKISDKELKDILASNEATKDATYCEVDSLEPECQDDYVPPIPEIILNNLNGQTENCEEVCTEETSGPIYSEKDIQSARSQIREGLFDNETDPFYGSLGRNQKSVSKEEMQNNLATSPALANLSPEEQQAEKMALEEKLQKLIGFESGKDAAEASSLESVFRKMPVLNLYNITSEQESESQKRIALYRLFQLLGFKGEDVEGKRKGTDKFPIPYQELDYVQYYQAQNVRQVAYNTEPFFSSIKRDVIKVKSAESKKEGYTVYRTEVKEQAISQVLFKEYYDKKTGRFNANGVNELFDVLRKQSLDFFYGVPDRSTLAPSPQRAERSSLVRFCEADAYKWKKDDDFEYIYHRTDHLRSELVSKASSLGYDLDLEKMNKDLMKSIAPVTWFIRHKFEPFMGWFLVILLGIAAAAFLIYIILPFAPALGAALSWVGGKAASVLGVGKIIALLSTGTGLKVLGLHLFIWMDIIWGPLGIVMVRHYQVDVHPAIQFQRNHISTMNLIDPRHLNQPMNEIASYDQIKEKLKEYRQELALYLGSLVVLDIPFSIVSIKQLYKFYGVGHYKLLKHFLPKPLVREGAEKTGRIIDDYIPKRQVYKERAEGQGLTWLNSWSKKFLGEANLERLSLLKPFRSLKLSEPIKDILPRMQLYKVLENSKNPREEFIHFLIQNNRRASVKEARKLKSVLSIPNKLKPTWSAELLKDFTFGIRDLIKQLNKSSNTIAKLGDRIKNGRFKESKAMQDIVEWLNRDRAATSKLGYSKQSLYFTMENYLETQARIRKYYTSILDGVKDSKSLYDEIVNNASEHKHLQKDLEDFLLNLEDLKPNNKWILNVDDIFNKNRKQFSGAVDAGVNQHLESIYKTHKLQELNNDAIKLLLEGKGSNKEVFDMVFQLWDESLESAKLHEHFYDVTTSSGFFTQIMSNRGLKGVKVTIEGSRLGTPVVKAETQGVGDIVVSIKDYFNFKGTIGQRVKKPLEEIIEAVNLAKTPVKSAVFGADDISKKLEEAHQQDAYRLTN